MRDYQYKTHQWLPGKNWANSTPLGPFLVTPDEVGDPHALDISLDLNGERLQSSNTRHFIFDIPTIVATISEFVPLGARRRRAHRHAERGRLPARAEGAAARRRPRRRGGRAGGAAREPRRRGVTGPAPGAAARRCAITFDNLGEVTELERGEFPEGEPLGRHFSVTRALPACWSCSEADGAAGDVLRRGVGSTRSLAESLRGLARPPATARPTARGRSSSRTEACCRGRPRRLVLSAASRPRLRRRGADARHARAPARRGRCGRRTDCSASARACRRPRRSGSGSNWLTRGPTTFSATPGAGGHGPGRPSPLARRRRRVARRRGHGALEERRATAPT